jgi:hypothetical protein
MVHPAIAAVRSQNSRDLVPHTAYQVDFVAVNCGKVVGSSKRNIRFKFGYTNIDALTDGKRGNDCRGAEHEIIVDWSLSSGKQAIVFDAQEIYFNVGPTTQTKIKHSWKDPLGHIFEIKIHAAGMSTKSNPDPDWRQYDLFIDGVSFFRMPKIFEIGVGLKEAYKLSPSPLHDGSNYLPRNEQFVPATNSFPEKSKTPEPDPPAVADLLSFDDMDAPSSVPLAPSQAPVQNIYQYAPAQAPTLFNNRYEYNNSYATAQEAPAPTTLQKSYDEPSSSTFSARSNPFENSLASYASPTTSATMVHAPAPAPMSSEQSSNPFSAPTNPFENSKASYVSPTGSPEIAQYQSATYQVSNPYNLPSNAIPNPQTNCVTPTFSCSALVPAEPALPPDFDAAVKNLVNIDDLFAYRMPSNPPAATTQHVNSHMSLGQLHGSNKPVMNSYNTVPNSQQQQGAFTGYSAQQHQPQQNPFNSYAQQSYAQSGFSYQ